MIELSIAGFSIIISLVALIISIRADNRSKSTAQSQVFLDLRERYAELHKELPEGYTDPSWTPTAKVEEDAIVRLLHQLFNEWYVTTQLSRADMHILWDQYFAEAIQYTLRHNSVRKSFWRLTNYPPESKNLYRLWRNDVDKVMKHVSAEYTDEAKTNDAVYDLKKE